jgi:hypothetical protein
MATHASGRRLLCLCAAACLAAVSLAGVLALAAKSSTTQPQKTSRKGMDLTVIEHERWLDTLKGTVKNYGPGSARDVTIIVRFVDKKNKTLGTQTVSVGDLGTGHQGSWSIAIKEKHRPAVRYEFEVHAIKP